MFNLVNDNLSETKKQLGQYKEKYKIICLDNKVLKNEIEATKKFSK
jgi:hypothetical protein